MNREIKFRGKRIDNGEWVYGYIVKSVNDRCYIIGYATEDAVNTRNEIDFMYNEVDHKTVGQCTGYKDKNKKEIYAEMSNKIEDIKAAVSGYKISDDVKNELLTMLNELDELRPKLKSDLDTLKIELAERLIEIYNEHGSDVINNEDETDPELATIYFKIKGLTKEKEQVK